MKYIDPDVLKAEIEKRMHICDDVFERNSDTYYQGKAVAYQETLSFIDSLQQEQPCDTCTNDKGCVTCKDGELWEGKEQPSEDLEKAVISIWKCRADGDASQLVRFSYDEVVALMRTGAEWQKEQMPSDEEMKCALRMEYEKGVFDTKQQMLKDAVEGYVNYYEDSGGILMAEAQIGCPYHNGDKVKIIIVPNEN